MLDRLTSMAVFRDIARLGSISAAARAHRMSPTMASKHLNALETALATPLMRRSTRRITLTEDGARYLEFCTRVLADFEDGQTAFRRRDDAPAGRLRVSAPYAWGTRFIAPALAPFAARYPDLRVDLDLSDRRVDLVEEGYDLAIRIGPDMGGRTASRRFMRVRGRLCAAPDYLAARGRPHRLVDLADHSCLGYTLSRSSGPDNWRLGRGAAGEVAIKGPLVSNSGAVLVAAAVSGLGIVVVPDFLVAEEIARGDLVEITLADIEPLDIGWVQAIWPARRRQPLRVRVFVDYLAQRLGCGDPQGNPQPTSSSPEKK